MVFEYNRFVIWLLISMKHLVLHIYIYIYIYIYISEPSNHVGCVGTFAVKVMPRRLEPNVNGT